MKPNGYSGTPLAKKLGLKEDFIIRLIDEPGYYAGLFEGLIGLPPSQDNPTIPKDIIYLFIRDITMLDMQLKSALKEIKDTGMIWVSWPKKTSKIISSVTENEIRDCALKNGLVDIKVCSIDQTWSGLNLVIPVKERKNGNNRIL